ERQQRKRSRGQASRAAITGKSVQQREGRSAGRESSHKMKEAGKPEAENCGARGPGKNKDRHHGRRARVCAAQCRVNRSSQQRPRNQYENTEFKQGYHEFVTVQARAVSPTL